MTTPSTARFVVFAFVAGFLATLVFNQSAGFVLNKVGIAPPGFTAWALDPVPPWGVPTIVSKAFWGGLWAVLLGLVLRFTRGGAYWASWILLGAVLPFACWYLHSTPAQRIAHTRLCNALSLRGQCQRSLGLWNRAHPPAHGHGETPIVATRSLGMTRANHASGGSPSAPG